jgi:isoleucyl-tRNA synthetase
MFHPVGGKLNFPQLEEKILGLWRSKNVFERSVKQRWGKSLFVLYDGPPTVNGSPAIHHALTSIFKDVIPRYKAMKGYWTPRIAGWDTHGLPVELEVEKALGFSGKAQIEEYGVAKFNTLCRESVYRYLKEFEDLIERIGYWVDLKNAYITMKNEYIETCWWALKQMWDKGLIYQGYKVTPHCPRCGTSLSSHEVAQGYKDDAEDPSVYIKFKLISKLPTGANREVYRRLYTPLMSTYFLAWTTTPWTLPGNTALAVAPEADYAMVEGNGERLILAQAFVEGILGDQYNLVHTLKGKELIGLEYEPLFKPSDFGVVGERLSKDYYFRAEHGQEAPPETYPIIGGDFVSLDEGTGIVHIAPAFGEIDYETGRTDSLYSVQPVDLQGRITGKYPFAGKFVKDADEDIIADLKSRGLLYRGEKIRHTYPFCWRCETPLLYYAKQTWYIRTTAVKEELIARNDEINWYPEHIKYGRFGDWLQNNVDWAFSRERYWGTPLPVWRCESCGSYECVGSMKELENKPNFSGFRQPLDLHRPFVDELTFNCSKCKGEMKRAPEVIDCWFDSGAMPIAQYHYPFDNKTLLEDNRFPADYISEAVDQTRGWFYSLHAISTLLFNRPSFRNVICLGHILDAQGEKMSKRKGNVVWPWAVINRYGADALRWYFLTATPPGNVRRFSEDAVAEVTRHFLLTLWNVYSFFVTYANIDRFTPGAKGVSLEPSELDRWIISELNQLIIDVDTGLDGYNPTEAGRKIESFVDVLSNWYVRRSRRRFWKSESDADKLAAYTTLYECLVTLSKLLAPFTPFLAEELYQNLVGSAFPEAPDSVHLADFPVADATKIDKQLSADIGLAMKVSSLGRAARSEAGIKVRQPLSHAVVSVAGSKDEKSLERLKPQILEELNVKDLKFGGFSEVAKLEGHGYKVSGWEQRVDKGKVSFQAGAYLVAIPTEVSAQLQAEGMAREIVRRLQTMRRNAGFDIADHIITYYQGEAYIRQVMADFADYIRQETLSRELIEGVPEEGVFTERYKLSGYDILLGVKRLAN